MWADRPRCQPGRRPLAAGATRRKEYSRFPLEPAHTEPIKIIRPHHHDVRLPSDSRKDTAAEHLDGDGAAEPGKIEFDDLCGSREVADHEHRVVSERPREREDAMVGGLEEFDRPAAEDFGDA